MFILQLKYSSQAFFLHFGILFAGVNKDLFVFTQQVVSFFLVAHYVDQLQVLAGEQQLVEVVQVHISALVILQGIHQGGNDRPLLFNPGYRIKDDNMYTALTC